MHKTAYARFLTLSDFLHYLHTDSMKKAEKYKTMHPFQCLKDNNMVYHYLIGLNHCQCVVPENIHTCLMEGIFSKISPPTPLGIPIKVPIILHFLGSNRTTHPTLQEIPIIPSEWGSKNWIFSGTAQYSFKIH